MADCIGNLTKNYEIDCVNPPIAGIETQVVLINRADIDFAATTFDPNNSLLITNLELQAGKTGYLFEGIKQVNFKNFDAVPSDTTLTKFTHGFTGTIYDLSVEGKQGVQELANATVIAVVENKWKGTDSADAFEILGFGSGLFLSSGTQNSNENEGAFLLTISTLDIALEPTVPHTLLETDYATTKAAFDNRFSGGAACTAVNWSDVGVTAVAACATVNLDVTYYKSGSPTVISVGDIVYQNNMCTNTVEIGFYRTSTTGGANGTGQYVEVNASGVILASGVQDCA